MEKITESQIRALDEKIQELTQLAITHNLNISREIAELNHSKTEMEKAYYKQLTPWDKLNLARHQERPTTLDYVHYICDDFIPLHGDRHFREDGAIVGGIGQIGTEVVTLIGHQKGRNTKENIERNFGMPHPEGYRKALRLMEAANRFGRPIICFVDTPGAYCGIGAEERGQGEAIARNLMESMGWTVPILVVVIGEGGSGGALALGLGNRIYMLEHSIYSVLSPEGFASILWKDSGRAKEAAQIMGITAQDLKAFHLIDEVLPEPLGGAHKDLAAMAKKIKSKLQADLAYFKSLAPEVIKAQRYEKFRQIGALAAKEDLCTQE